jgi:hypothetical protein
MTPIRRKEPGKVTFNENMDSSFDKRRKLQAEYDMN